ncbi:hypothetical protein CIB84_007250 [Bambusicola thoracicus]|uniref:Uncharacterized protein n=1 Tax=Bambusicola thoracicus TaxID=9083 RepID=A0A2P4SHP3_BAMTH|nr:hypothetical protein CIB84_012660 [Bambusicola thoracicus]POI29001.1 hypothetical protein CIB84_007250 [Bambusicola thoracicus]
MNQQKQHFGK